MFPWLFLLLLKLYTIEMGKAQMYTCPYEDGIFYATNPECLIYYRCEKHMLWTGVCFPWQRFDIHSLSCTRLTDVDCNPEYAGVWRMVYERSVDESKTEQTKDASESDNAEFQSERNVMTGETYEVGTESREIYEDYGKSPLENKNNNKENNKEIFKDEDSKVEISIITNLLSDNKVESVTSKSAKEPNKLMFENYKVSDADMGNENGKEESKQNTYTKDMKEKCNLQVLSDITVNCELEAESITREKIEIYEKLDSMTSIKERRNVNDNNAEAKDKLYFEKKLIASQNRELNKIKNPSSPITTKQEDSSGSFWYWCGSGRFVVAQNSGDGDKLCLQLQDPEFINEEGSAQQQEDFAGHTFLGSHVNPL